MIQVARAVRHTQTAYLLSGLPVDRYLQSCGALAQAFNSEIILVSSAAKALPPGQRRLLYLHEFAHLQQLVRTTGAPNSTEQLEAEAWLAADCWSRGLPYQVAGRGSEPLNALALIQGGPAGHPSAPPWYRSNPIEPISAADTITVDDVAIIEDMTLDSVLDAIIGAKSKDIVVVSHGTSEGLTLRTHNGASVMADRNVLTALAADHRTEQTDIGGTKIVTPIKTAEQVKDLMKTDLARVADLRKKMNDVRARKLNHLAFRACDMGSSEDTLHAFLDFFGCASISAPTIEDMYGTFAAKPAKDLAGWIKEQRKNRFHVFAEGKVAFASKWAQGIYFRLECRGADVTRSQTGSRNI